MYHDNYGPTITSNSHYSHKTYSQLPLIGTFKGNRKKFEVLREKLYRKLSERK